MRATPRTICPGWRDLSPVPVADGECPAALAVPMSVQREVGTLEQRETLGLEACAARVVFLRRQIEDLRRMAERFQKCGAGG